MATTNLNIRTEKAIKDQAEEMDTSRFSAFVSAEYRKRLSRTTQRRTFYTVLYGRT